MLDTVKETYLDLTNAIVSIMRDFGVPVDMVSMNSPSPEKVIAWKEVSQWGILILGLCFKSLDKVTGSIFKS